MKPKQPYCLMPFLHLHISNKGVAKACCVANIPFGDINKQSLEEIWNGESINQLREKFLKGEKDNRCAQCIHRESTGGKSIRQETFEKFPNFELSENSLSAPIYFDIRFSNVCNFRCRTCWHGASSKWFSDAKILGRNLGQKAILKNIQDFEDFISKTGPALKNAEEIYFAGGEPLVTEEHYLLLEWLIQQGATQMKLRYNTNFSVLNFKQWKVLNLWKQFQKVEILASIDASEELGEIIRKEMKWSTILKNRKAIQALPHLSFQIAPTISILNMAHLPKLYSQSVDLQLIEKEDFYINILERPFYYNIQAFPQEKKEEIQSIYNAFFLENNLSIKIKALFQECLDFMWAEDKSSKHWQQFLMETSKIDELRKENLNNVLPCS